MEGRQRIVIEAITPQVDCGRFPVQRVAGDELLVEADIFGDGHDQLSAVLLYRRQGDENWLETPMLRRDNDRWQGSFLLAEPGLYHYTLLAWVDRFRSWQSDLRKRVLAGQVVAVDLQVGVGLIEQAAEQATGADAARLWLAAAALAKEQSPRQATALGLDEGVAALISAGLAREFATRCPTEFPVRVDRQKAAFSSWYELFPRSLGAPGRHGTFEDCLALLPEIAELGFDVLYLPPIHPIGVSRRKGRGNAPEARPGDPGSPWAIGSALGGHTSVHPELGSLEDFRRLVEEAGRLGIEIALDLAFQCSPDHPYLKEHPEWFLWRPDGSVQYAENPPKKYQDIVPFNFESCDWRALWEELQGVVFHWMDLGVRIFRVDNPHTKPFPFWEWLIARAKERSPETLFLAEAFTRPKVMNRLAKIGFSQSYSYFAWRTSKEELTSYLTELTRGEPCEYLRPNFWPNTPDILCGYLQQGGRSAFLIRLVLAATLSSNYGIYGPPFELCLGEALPASEEYLHAEKYEIRVWDRDRAGNLKGVITLLNRIRRQHSSLQRTGNLEFLESDNDSVIFFAKRDCKDGLLVAVNLDPFHFKRARLRVPLAEFGIRPGESYLVHDLLSGDKFLWSGEWNSVELPPETAPARIFAIATWQRREADFDYYL